MGLALRRRSQRAREPESRRERESQILRIRSRRACYRRCVKASRKETKATTKSKSKPSPSQSLPLSLLLARSVTLTMLHRGIVAATAAPQDSDSDSDSTLLAGRAPVCVLSCPLGHSDAVLDHGLTGSCSSSRALGRSVPFGGSSHSVRRARSAPLRTELKHNREPIRSAPLCSA